MKNFFLPAFFLFLNQVMFGQTWTWSDNNPVAGTDLIVKVQDLETNEDMHIVAHYFQGNDFVSSDVNYILEGDALKMTLRVPETHWLRLVVKDENNDAVTGDHRDVVWAGGAVNATMIDYARATAAYYRVLGLEKNDSMTLDLYRQAITAAPSWLDDPYIVSSYYQIAKNAGAMKDMAAIQFHISEKGLNTNAPSQDFLISSLSVAEKSGDTILYRSLRKKLDMSYPQSLIHQQDALTAFREASTLADKIILRDKFKDTYGVTSSNSHLYDRMTDELVDECAALGQWEQMEGYIKEIMDPSTRASACNNYAWDLAGAGLQKEAIDLDMAHDLSALSLMTLSPQMKKPATMSQSEWERSLEFDKAMYGDTYALILYKQGKYEDAVEHQASAVKNYNYLDREMNERYVIYLDKAGQKDMALSFAEKMIREGLSTSAIKAYHEKAWTEEKSQADLYHQYLAELEAAAIAKKRNALQRSWLDEAPSAFSLTDVDGKTVALGDYKGKTVVLDFWATWCGPCVASFPGMKAAVQHFANDPQVVFLFVNTFENIQDRPAKLRKYIADNDYPFHVLIDEESKLAEMYQVQGIPTKIVIGPDQKMRFKSVGYGGNNEELTEELITMIEMARQGGPSVTP